MYLAQANYDKAKVEFRNVLQIDPRTPEAYYLIGVINEEQQDWPGAFGSYLKTVELDPNHINAKIKLGRLYLLTGNAQEAEALAAEIRAKRPDEAGGRFLNAALMARKGDAAAAIVEANAALAADPKHVDAISLLAGLYTQQGEDAKAAEILERGIQTNPKSVPLRLDLAGVSMRRHPSFSLPLSPHYPPHLGLDRCVS